MTRVYLGLGSNLGDREHNLGVARNRLGRKGVRILREGTVVETEPWGDLEQPKFLNQVVEGEWLGTPRRLLQVVKQVEREGGRKPTRRWGPRVIDVDILLFGGRRVREPDLVIPHPRIAERPFVHEALDELGVSPASRW